LRGLEKLMSFALSSQESLVLEIRTIPERIIIDTLPKLIIIYYIYQIITAMSIKLFADLTPLSPQNPIKI